VIADQDAGETAVPGRGDLVACAGTDAVNRTERIMCGTGAVDSAAAAQGVALAGGRAAVLLGATATHPLVISGRGTGAWISHCCRAEVGDRSPFAFEILARDAQQAVDHCLVAHHLASRIGRPGQCAVDPETAEELSLLRLPSGTDGLPEGVAAAETDVLVAARESFAAIGEWTGRPCLPVERAGPEPARYVIVAAGAAWARGCAAARRLVEEGVDCAVIGLALLNPTPTDELQNAIGDAVAVTVLDPHGAVPGQVHLTNLIRAAIAGRGERPVHGLVSLPRTTQVLADALRQTFGLEGASSPTPVVESPTTGVSIGAVPAGDWSESLLLEAAARRAEVDGDMHLARLHLEGISAITTGGMGDTKAGLDVLVAAHHSLLDQQIVAHLRDGAVVLILSESPAGGPPPALVGDVHTALKQAGALLLWQPARDSGPVDDETQLTYHAGGVLACADRITESLPGVDATREVSATLTAGAASVTALSEVAPGQVASSGPRVVDEAGGEPDSEWVEALRRFHVAGTGGVTGADPIRGLPLRPWLLEPLLAAQSQPATYPVVVRDGRLSPFVEAAGAAVENHESQLLGPHLTGLAEAMAARSGTGSRRRLVEALDESRTDFAAGLDLGPAAATTLTIELDSLREVQSGDAVVLGLGRETLVELLALAAARARDERTSASHEEIKHLVRRLEERLQIDAEFDNARRDPEELSAAFGGGAQLDVHSLAGQLTVRRGSESLSETRRHRIDASLNHLRRFLQAHEERQPAVVLLHPHIIDAEELPEGVAAVAHNGGMDAAAGYFEAAARQMIDLFRALRTARLEVEDAYLPEHDAMLARLDWQALSQEELALVPSIFVLETADRVLSHALSALSTLLRSGRPLHLIILDSSAAMDSAGDPATLATSHPDLGTLAMAHRDALVLQTSLVQPGHLYDGLTRLAASPRTSVAVIAVPEWDGAVEPWVQLTAAHQARETPCYLYDPDAGSTWAQRFDLSPNPDIDEPWPRLVLQAEDATGKTVERQEVITFAHAAALAPRCRHAFRVIPAEAWGPEQLPIVEYLDLAPPDRMRRIPYLWVVTNEGRLARAVMTRAMAHACADRLQQWLTLQELGGHRSESARRAATEARDLVAAEAQTQPDVPAQSHSVELGRGRADVTGEIVERLARALLTPDGENWPQILAEGGKVVEPTPPTGHADVEEEKLVEEGFIDSPMCTTCHDCINVNPRMFQYDSNKQALLADPTAGTFAELVKAAEACPARCIHPGAPRDGDSTATPALVKRARKFN